MTRRLLIGEGVRCRSVFAQGDPRPVTGRLPGRGHARSRANTFCALEFAITAMIPNSAAALTVNATILPLLFLSGVFIPIGDIAPA